MKKQIKAGFALIELLVVVLIIGILAAVAVPQYKKAVVKSHFAAIKPILFSIKKAHEVSYLQNGIYSSAARELLGIPNICKEPASHIYNCGHGFLINSYHDSLVAIRAFYCPGSEKNYSECTTNKYDFVYTIYLHHSNKPDKRECWGISTLGKRICGN